MHHNPITVNLGLLRSNYHTTWRELRRLEDIAEERALSLEEQRKHKILSEILVSLAKEERAQEKAANPSSLDNDELMEKMKEAMKVLSDGES
jgi:hypothetical protein